MDEREFWAIIEASRPATRDDQEEQLAALRELLSKLPPEKVAGFELAFRTAHDRAFHWDLWAAAYVIRGGCGDDSFDYFRSWLISQGRERYERTLAEPDSLSEMDLETYEPSFEEVAYLADEIYEELTGSEIPAASTDLGDHDEGEGWEETDEELRARVPRLFAKYQDRETEDDGVEGSSTATGMDDPSDAATSLSEEDSPESVRAAVEQVQRLPPPIIMPGFWGRKASLNLYSLRSDLVQDLAQLVEDEEIVEFSVESHSAGETDLSFLEEFPMIRSVIVKNTGLDDISPLARLAWLHHLQIKSNCETVLDFTGLEKLFWLNVEWKRGFEGLFDLPWLRVLQLRSCPWRSSRQLGRLTGLKALDLSLCGFRELSALAKLQDLVGLSLCAVRSFDRYEDLGRIPNLRRLQIRGMQVTDRGLGSLGSVQGLTHLGLHGYLGDGGAIPSLKPLLDLPNLEYVNLHASEVADRDLTPLIEHPNIEKIYIDPGLTEGYSPGGYDYFDDLGKMTDAVDVWIPPWGEE